MRKEFRAAGDKTVAAVSSGSGAAATPASAVGGRRGKGGVAGAGTGVGLAAASDGGGSGGEGHLGGRGDSAVFPALCRQSAPRGEPLCCKQLAQVPLSRVVVVRSGVVTLCAEGLLKLWARPTVPPPLLPPGAGTRLRDSVPAASSRGEVSGCFTLPP